MKTLDLNRERPTLEEILKLAAAESVRILTSDGRVFVLEEANDFDKEVELLGKSEKFKQFLEERSKEPATRSLDDFRRSLGL